MGIAATKSSRASSGTILTLWGKGGFDQLVILPKLEVYLLVLKPVRDLC